MEGLGLQRVPESVLVGERLTKFFPLTTMAFFRRWLGLPPRDNPFVALSEVDLEVKSTQFLGVLGSNGAGKSTLLRVIGGVFHPDSGFVQRSGEASLISEMGQFVNPHLTGRQVAEQYVRLMHPEVRDLGTVIESIKDFAELGDYFEEPTKTFSSGMLARLIFSIATEVQEPLYLIDEFLVVGDQYFIEKAWARLAQRLGTGASGVVSTHDWTAVLRLCQQCIVLREGRVIDQGPTAGVVARYLDIPLPQDPHARLVIDESISATTDNLTQFEFGVSQASPSSLEIAWTIEQFSAGRGWENLLHQEYTPIPSALGLTRFKVCYEHAVIDSGMYVLNLFLRRRLRDGSTVPADVRSWTTGNGIDLLIPGRKQPAPLMPRVHWTFRGTSDD